MKYRFLLNNAPTEQLEPNQRIFITGNIEGLGFWNKSRFDLMEKRDNCWSSPILETVTEDDIQNVEYKYVIDVINHNYNGVEENADWEQGENRNVNLTSYF